MIKTASDNNNLQFLTSKKAISKKAWVFTAIMLIFHGLMAWTFEKAASIDDWWLHGLWCFIGLLIAIPVLVRATANGVASSLVDHKVVLLAVFVLYFIFGAALLTFGSVYDIDNVLRSYPLTAIDALAVDGFNSVGMGIALLTACAVRKGLFLGGVRGLARRVSQIPIHFALLILFIFGLFGYLLTVARDLGLIYLVIPGAVGQLAMLLLFCIFLGSAYKGKMSIVVQLLCIFSVIVMAVAGALLFNKTGIYMPILAYAGGLAVRTHNSRYLLMGFLVVAITLSFIGDMTSYGRSQTAKKVVLLTERVQIIDDYFSSTTPEEDKYSGWSRLCYMPIQVASLDFYKQGNGGNGLQLIPWLFVPRFIASNKPIITASGSELNYKIFGYYTSSVAMGVFVSGYYNEGWLGFFFASIFCGWFLAQTSLLTAMLIEEKAYILLPMGILGIYTAFRIDGEIIADFLGSFTMILYPLVALMLIFGITSRLIGSK